MEKMYEVTKEQYEFILKAQREKDIIEVDKLISSVQKTIDKKNIEKEDLETLKTNINDDKTTFKEYTDKLEAEAKKKKAEREAKKAERENNKAL